MIKRPLAVLVVAAACAALAPAAGAKPEIDRTCNGSQTCDAWFRSPVTIRWTVTAGWPTAGCVNETITQDTAGSLRGCIAYDGSETTSREITIRLDQTPPIITAAIPNRLPDHAGWYTHPVTFTAQASDVTSGLAGCDAPSYSGPDSANASVVASCKDRAGNAASRAFPLSYDATAPDPGGATLDTGDRRVRLTWPAGSTATVLRTPGRGGAASDVLYKGQGTGFTDRRVRNGKRYRYVLTLTDAAGNSASRELPATPGKHLIAPVRRATVSAPPLLTWTPDRDARYYNVQLYRDGRKILSKWPKKARLQLKAKWRYRGNRYRLKPGVYKWYVWPGKGPREARKYGKRIGRRSFTVLSQ